MATRINNDVTLPHELADQVARILADYASQQFDHAHTTRSEPVRHLCQAAGIRARALASRITTQLWTWSELRNPGIEKQEETTP